jgi:hypothetical protein
LSCSIPGIILLRPYFEDWVWLKISEIGDASVEDPLILNKLGSDLIKD